MIRGPRGSGKDMGGGATGGCRGEGGVWVVVLCIAWIGVIRGVQG